MPDNGKVHWSGPQYEHWPKDNLTWLMSPLKPQYEPVRKGKEQYCFWKNKLYPSHIVDSVRLEMP